MPLFSDTASAIKNPGALDFDEDDGKSTSCNGTFEFREDPSFWKNHNVQGATNRKVAATNMNHASSHSHSVFTCTIESKWESQGVTHHRFARLNLVDLEGSERRALVQKVNVLRKLQT